MCIRDRLIHRLEEKEKIESLDCKGLRETEFIYVEKLNHLRKERAITADASIKFELKKEMKEAEIELDDIRAEMIQKGCVEVEANVSENS